MDILDINTDELRNYVSIAKKASRNIDQATKLLQQIEVHDDWICPQRETLKQLTNHNRKTAEVIQSWSLSFYNAIDSASQAFDDCENASIASFKTLDSVVASIATVLPGTFTTSGIGSAVINAVPFKNVKDAMEGK